MHKNRQPYFIDDFNTYCAVGYLMQQSGADAMAKEIHQSQNYLYLQDIQHPQLINWVQQSGFSFDELALIQPSYGNEYPCYITEIHYNNVGTDVNEYLEIIQPGFYASIFGALNFDSAFLYNESGDIYKKIARNQMIKVGTNYDTIYYYSFASGDTLADLGSIDLVNTSSTTPIKVFNLTYNIDSVITTSISGSFVWDNSRQSFATVESNNTPIGYSLNFCGYYPNRNAIISPKTNAYKNSCVITPVILSTFNGKLIENKVELNWQTETEINNNYFKIERSNDGNNFTVIGKVLAKKNVSNNYTFIDAQPNYLNHYRLKQIDIDGKFVYSKILYVKFPNANPLKVISNLSKNLLQINIGLDNSKIKELLLYDLFGRKLKSYQVHGGSQTISLPKLKTEKYILLLITNQNESYQNTFFVLE